MITIICETCGRSTRPITMDFYNAGITPFEICTGCEFTPKHCKCPPLVEVS